MFKQFVIYAICFGFWLCILPFSLEAQEYKEPLTLRFEPKLAGEIYRFTMRSTGDSYYFSDIWLNGDVLLESGKKVRDKKLKYNIYTDELVWLTDINHQQVKVDKGLVKEFLLIEQDKTRPLLFRKLPLQESLSSRPNNTFLQELYSGEVSLMAHRKAIKSGERTSRSGSTLYSVAKIRLKPDFYIIKPDNKIVKIGRFKKLSLYKIFSENRAEIRKAFRAERLRIRSEKDLIKAISIIDKIVSQ